MKKVAIIIPCYNEEKNISSVIQGIPHKKLKGLGYVTEVIVVDNNSSDRTAQIAKSLGARVVKEKKQGKGYAVVKGFKSLPNDAEKVVMLDGDNTYKSYEMVRLIEPLDSGFCEVVIGTRLSGKLKSQSMTFLNRAGNWLLTFLVRFAYHGNITDVCSGYFAWNRDIINELVNHLESGGFSIEMEMITKMAKLGYEIFSIPITYEDRNGTHSKLRPLKDGMSIFATWLRNLYWRPGYKQTVSSIESEQLA